VLARECSIKEIEKFKPLNLQATINHQLSTINFPSKFSSTARCASRIPAVPDERVARRPVGQPRECAQACRMPYDLISDGQLFRSATSAIY